MTARQDIRIFIERLLGEKGDRQPVVDDESLVLAGRLASIDVLELVIFLETRFGLDFAKTGFDATELDSIGLIDEFVRRHGPA